MSVMAASGDGEREMVMWTEADVIAWLKKQSFEGLEIQNFIESKVNGEKLSSLTKEGLEELGIASSLHQIKASTIIKRECDRLKGVYPEEHTVETWSEDGVITWLSTQNFVKGRRFFCKRFKEEGIDGAMLAVLDDAALQELNVGTPPHRKVLRDAIDQLLLDPEGAAQKGKVSKDKYEK